MLIPDFGLFLANRKTVDAESKISKFMIHLMHSLRSRYNLTPYFALSLVTRYDYVAVSAKLLTMREKDPITLFNNWTYR